MKKAIGALLALPALLLALMLGSAANASQDGGDQCLSGTPAEYAEVLTRAGSLCDLITPAILAAQVQAESNWDPKVSSAVGAQGIAQFMPGTWAAHGMDGNGDGKADVWDPIDAIWSQGNYMCEINKTIASWLDSGKVTGDALALTLAGYNAGLGNVETHAGVPPFAETQGYIDKIVKSAGGFTQGCSSGVASSNEIVAEAQSYHGVPYVWGGESPSGVDCSGLVKIVFAKFGIQLPHLADSQAHLGQEIPRDKIQPGDVIAFRYAGATT